MSLLKDVSNTLIAAAFKIGAIKIQPDDPFTWASKWKSLIYNDNRLLLGYPTLRKLVTDGLEEMALQQSYFFTVVAGIATAGIPHGAYLADRMRVPYVYIRDKPKDHGMRNRIEGIPADQDLKGQSILVIEDLISTGSSSADGVQAVRNANGIAPLCLSIFSYNFPIATETFNGERPFNNEGQRLEFPCKIDSIIKYSDLIQYGIKEGYVKKEHQDLLMQWSSDPQGWSDRWIASHPE
jgi:orotate phosphoribosyltransferase